MATRREDGTGSTLRREQRNDNSSPYKRRQPVPAAVVAVLFISGAFIRESSERARVESGQSEDGGTTGADPDER
ncbi:hypothetical protein FRC11_012921, partial [Ceratobasidium sp. 423]